MNYWMTTHWPPEEGEPADQILPAVYLPDDGREQAGSELAQGDRVLIYQAQSGRARLDPQPDGSIRRVECQRGRGGIVAVVELDEALRPRPNAEREQYEDGSEIRWGYRARGRVLLSRGFVPIRKVNEVLSYKQNFNLRGFGDQHSGLKKLTAAQFDELLAAYEASGGTRA